MIMVTALRLILERLRLGGRVGNRQSSVEESYDAQSGGGLGRLRNRGRAGNNPYFMPRPRVGF
jgi:hypothetical protein